MTGETMRDDDEGRVGEVIYPGDFVDYKPRALTCFCAEAATPPEPKKPNAK